MAIPRRKARRVHCRCRNGRCYVSEMSSVAREARCRNEKLKLNKPNSSLLAVIGEVGRKHPSPVYKREGRKFISVSLVDRYS